MKRMIFSIIVSVFIQLSFSQMQNNIEMIKEEIYQTEKAFEKMASDKGLAEAFYYFADEDAVILRENDSIIKGKENIKAYYLNKPNKNVSINWTPDYIDVSEDGTLGYSYGKYILKTTKQDGSVTESKGIFHTVWKKQADNSWKYVWD